MELKPGYKLTEVGVIPEDWAVELLGDIGRWYSGGTPSMFNTLYWKGDIPWISAKDMKVCQLHDSILHVTEKAIGNGTRLAPSGAVLMVVRGMILAHTLPVAIAMRPLAFNQDLKALISHEEIDDKFILFWLLSNAQKLLRIASDSTHGTKRIPSDDLFAVKVAFPPLSEQTAIATALSDVDELLRSLDRLIAKKRDIKQATMQQLLTGKTRLPGFENEWEVKQLGDIADVIDPHPSHRAPAEFTNGIPFVGIGDLNENGEIIGNKIRLVNQLVLEEHLMRYNLKDELIGLGRVASIGKVISLKEFPNSYVISPTLGLIRSNKVNRNYLLYALKSKFVAEQFLKIMSGSTRSSIGMEVLRELQINVPPTIPEQTAIAQVLSDMDTEIATLEQRRDKTRALKQGMMQQLLTGRIRLKH